MSMERFAWVPIAAGLAGRIGGAGHPPQEGPE